MNSIAELETRIRTLEQELADAKYQRNRADSAWKAEAAASLTLSASLRDVQALIEAGELVRNTRYDANPNWAIKQVGLVKTLAEATALLTRLSSHTKEEKCQTLVIIYLTRPKSPPMMGMVEIQAGGPSS